MSHNVPLGPFKCMVILGESTVEGGGWLAKREERWPDILRRLLETAQEEPLSYFNAGLGASVISPRSPGYFASAKPSASERLEKEVIAHGPDIAVIAYGLNDMRAGMSLHDFRIEMEGLIKRLRKTINPLIVIVNVYHMPDYRFYPPFNHGSMKMTKQYNKMLRELAEETRCVYADVWNAEGERDYVVHPDTVHANKIGNMLIAHKVFESIVHAAPGMAVNVQKRDANTDWARRCLRRQRTGVEQSRGSTPGGS